MKTKALRTWSRRGLFASLAILTALTLGGGGKDPRSGSVLLERVGSWPGFTRGPALSVAVADHHAFVAIGEGGLAVLDVTDPAKPVRVGSYRPPGRTELVRVVGRRAYLATAIHAGGGCELEGWRGRLVILDVSDPTSPRLLGVYTTGDAINSFCVDGDWVFLYDGHHFHIFDVGSPARPVALHVGWPPGLWANSVLWSGGQRVYAAQAAQDVDWAVLDANQPDSLTVVANVPGVEPYIRIHAIQVVSNRVYVAAGDFGGQDYPSSGRVSIYDLEANGVPNFLGKLDLAHVALSVQVAGNYAYVATAQEGVTVIDVSNPSLPVRVETWDTDGVAIQVEIAGDHAFVADYYGGLQVFDIRNPGQFVQVASFDTGLTSREVRVLGSKACVLSSDTHSNAYPSESRSRLEIVDISNPTQPALLESREAPYSDLLDMLPSLGFDRSGAGQHVADGYAYAGMGWEGFSISDVHNPNTGIGSYDTLGEVRDLWATNRYAYVAEGWEGLEVFDVSQPAQPLPIGRAPTRGQAVGVRVTGNYAYVAEGGGGLAIFSLVPGPVDIIGDPVSLGVAAGDTANLTVRAYGRGPLSYQWYLGESGDVTRPIAGANSASYTTPALSAGSAHWVQISGGGGVIDSRTAWVHLVPSVAVELLSLWPSYPEGYSGDVMVSGHYAYLGGESGLTVLDVSDPAAPILVSRVAEGRDWVEHVATIGDRLYTSCGPSAAFWGTLCRIFDIANRAQPSLLGTIQMEVQGVGAFVAAGEYLYIGGQGLQIIDVRNPHALFIAGGRYLVGDVPLGGGMFLDEGYAFWARRWAGLQILDLSVPTEPRHVGAYYPEAPVVDVAVRGSFAFLTEGSDLAGLEVIDIGDPQCPVRAAKVSLPVANNIQMMGSYACVTGDGLEVFDIGDPYHPVRVGHHQLGSATTHLRVVGNLVYVAAGEKGLAIYRVVPQLKLNPPVRDGNGLLLSWLGAPGLRLQQATNLSSAAWDDVPTTEGLSSLHLSPTNRAAFFRLVKP
jgi:hypothetical protein